MLPKKLGGALGGLPGGEEAEHSPARCFRELNEFLACFRAQASWARLWQVLRDVHDRLFLRGERGSDVDTFERPLSHHESAFACDRVEGTPQRKGRGGENRGPVAESLEAQWGRDFEGADRQEFSRALIRTG